MTEVPVYRELPISPEHPPRSSWGVWGADDEIGAMNLLTPERTLAASRLVRRGATFSLNWELDQPDPPILGRGALQHTVIDGPSGPDDRYDAFYPQASSQWDALAHVRHPRYGSYNGWPTSALTAEHSRFGIDAWARRGLAGRFVLVDAAGYLAERGDPIDGGTSRAISLAELRAMLDAQGVALTPGTFLLLDVGWIDWYLASDDATRRRLAAGADFSTTDHDLEHFFPAPGLSRAEEMAEFLWDSGVVAVAADCPAVEAMPMQRDDSDGFLHYRLAALLGIGIGEMWDLRALAADCRADGVYEGFLASAPLNKRGGTGSPANALAFK
ncbi:cyclase family protein [Protaetiibacter mangrovi]|uniref:Cyclase family protein n=1 Tax=Protaetiibacter mangrovi TaxID=2970926 RepID=A0ABT1ZDV8_9MICO|nr:cyclase family protein [Protaetiibacter mangrovi]MCS0498892.1 cyclase family protein [Protaetiibacter mangrovi]TPX04390.1 cyclase family protein [Schumannella luteola]